MPLYVKDYLADTGHLSAAEHGCYLLLLMHQWQHGLIPDNPQALSRICRCRVEDWSRRYKGLLDFFEPVAGGYRHTRLASEAARSEEISNKRKAAAVQMHSKRTALAHTYTYTSTKKEKKEKKERRVAPHPIPDNWHPMEHLSSEDQLELEKMRDWARAKGVRRADWFATWRNWKRRAAEYRQERNGNAAATRKGKLDAALAKLDHFIQSGEDETEYDGGQADFGLLSPRAAE